MWYSFFWIDEGGICQANGKAPKPDEVLTKEKKNVLVSTFLTWSVEDPIRYLVTVSDRAGAEARLTAIMRSEVDTALGAHPLSDLVSEEEGDEGRASIAEVSAGYQAGVEELSYAFFFITEKALAYLDKSGG